MNLKSSLNKGFTLGELVISLAIISLITGVVVFNHSKFTTDIEITNVAYRVALAVREAQVYSISVRQFTQNMPGSFNVSYGLHLNMSDDTQLIFFGDFNNDGKYTPGTGNDLECNGTECLKKIILGRGNKIKKLCGLEDIQSECYEPAPQILDFNFKRPNPDAILRPHSSNYSCGTPGCSNLSLCGRGFCEGWAICLISPQGREKRVVVYRTGQISVENVESGNSEDPCG